MNEFTYENSIVSEHKNEINDLFEIHLKCKNTITFRYMFHNPNYLEEGNIRSENCHCKFKTYGHIDALPFGQVMTNLGSQMKP